MNGKKETNIEQPDDYRAFLLLDEISRNQEITQRDMSSRLGIALGLINSYIKNLASKGYITVSAIPSNRYKYYLTPQGFVEKTRLTYHHLQNFTSLYRVARQDFKSLFGELYKSNVRRVVLCGTDEVAEIAYITLQEFAIELAAVADIVEVGRRFFGMLPVHTDSLKRISFDKAVIASFAKSSELHAALIKSGVPAKKIVIAENMR